jgi:hypothetical protein
MIVTYYSHSKTLTIQVMEFEIFRTSKYVSKFQKSFTTCRWGCNVHNIYNKVVAYNKRN